MSGCPFEFLHRKKGNSKHSHDYPMHHNQDTKLSLGAQEVLHTQSKFVGLTESDLANLKELRPIMERSANRIVTAFYARLKEIPHLLQIIDKHSTIDRLKVTLEQYLIEMVQGKVDEKYIQGRIRIGQVHNRIKLFPEWYIGAYTLIQNELYSVLKEEELHPDKMESLFLSFQKLCSFDMQIGISTYIKSYTASMMKLNEIKSLQEKLDESAATLAAGAEETTSSISDKETLVNHMISEIKNINHVSAEMVKKVELGKQEVSTSLVQVDDLAKTIKDTKNLTKKLADSSDEIGIIVQTIRSISNQTNILSLNASIEAQRAGVHGKGFAVVASEVRKLATQTQLALDNIHHQISMVQETISDFEKHYVRISEDASSLKYVNEKIMGVLDNTVENVEETSERIERFNMVINDFKNTFEEISAASFQVASMAEHLNNLNYQISSKLETSIK
ncbi:globin-coupled sensor protein [Bacillus sp. B1-b2]|uniref:globin-coupled sensor protein n=1 Tax=Bacillus sp. B1-b2 TaxID=2653201 RepID=UPI001261CFFE|nr:globin-coupled sensor protein [Bacillus sp. B1-b2]KAB7668791.1 chemotaxis protein [Bacillus sp. B1-b2]